LTARGSGHNLWIEQKEGKLAREETEEYLKKGIQVDSRTVREWEKPEDGGKCIDGNKNVSGAQPFSSTHFTTT